MIDIHAHILPGIDDGCACVEESVQLLRSSRQQGVELIFATPHYLANCESPEAFLLRREEAFRRIPFCDAQMPQIRLGAEVAYFSNMDRSDALQMLTLGDTRLLLLEMPFIGWTDRMITEVCSLRRRQGLIPVLAHVERYGRKNQLARYRSQLEEETLFQCNAEYFLQWTTTCRALKQLRNGKIQFLGSDAHNMHRRPQRLGAAMAVISRRLGQAAVEQFEKRESEYLQLFKTE